MESQVGPKTVDGYRTAPAFLHSSQNNRAVEEHHDLAGKASRAAKDPLHKQQECNPLLFVDMLAGLSAEAEHKLEISKG